jgi:hypothetical protein
VVQIFNLLLLLLLLLLRLLLRLRLLLLHGGALPSASRAFPTAP